ncbi:MAG: kelch repeat-containing protein [Myxococcaceae bacterium]
MIDRVEKPGPGPAVLLALLLSSTLAWAQDSGRFLPAGSLTTSRTSHTATLLNDGRVLVVGGRGVDSSHELASCELWDPAKKRFKPCAVLHTGRAGHTATLLDDGRVLVAGGTSAEGDRYLALSSVELYDPKKDTWTEAAPMAQARNWHAAAKLPDGRVVVAGGAREQRSHLDSVEAYDPKTNKWSPLPPLKVARCLHSLLPFNGGLLAAGGRSNAVAVPSTEAPDGGSAQRPHGSPARDKGFGVPIASSEVLAPNATAWALAPDLVEPVQRHAAAVMADGRAAVLGGTTGAMLTNYLELLSPDAGAWTVSDTNLNTQLASESVDVLPNGDLLVVGGEPNNAADSAVAQRLQLSNARWCFVGELKAPRKQHTATLLKDGKVLVVGGVSAGLPEASAELWEPREGACVPPPVPSLEW